MSPALIVLLAATPVVAVALLCVAGRRRLQAQLDTARAEVDALRSRVDDLAAARGPADEPAPEGPEYLITSIGPPASPTGSLAVPEPGGSQLTAGEFASVALAESLVRLLSLAYGVRRALSAESRNRIRFEVRREVKRSRRQRRQDLKEAKRHLRADPRQDRTEDAA